jgi:EAL domain-containing protein (putative c-di-GMP-specific phosphodiesterase class I)
MHNSHNELVRDLIDERMLVTMFQPVLSIRNRRIVGYEALSRGRRLDGGPLMDPSMMFEKAAREECVVELDRLCREKAVEAYCVAENLCQKKLLFINIDVSVLDMGVAGSGHIAKLVEESKISAQDVVIEFSESSVKDLRTLENFTDSYRDKGFLIALDDVGSGSSNLRRIAEIKPEIIKLSTTLVWGMMGEYYMQRIFKSLADLAHDLGAMVVASGIETPDQALTCLELGANFLQGFYFAKPGFSDQISEELAHERINELADKYRESMLSKACDKDCCCEEYGLLIDEMTQNLSGQHPDSFEEIISIFLVENDDVECIFILDEKGVLETETLCGIAQAALNKRLLFRPAEKGSDQSSKEYFFRLKAGIEMFTSGPYISLASGNFCITVSKVFKDIKGDEYILCVDILPGDKN